MASDDGESDSNRLGKALDYFAGGKYHEALILLVDIDKKYNLNPRFKAYIGVCYYYEWDYKEACRYLDAIIPELEVYAPHERSIYYNAAAESHFNLAEYNLAIPLYERQLLVCYDNEKGDAFYRLGFCYMFIEKRQIAADYFNSALQYYTRFNPSGKENRITQIGKMLNGLKE